MISDSHKMWDTLAQAVSEKAKPARLSPSFLEQVICALDRALYGPLKNHHVGCPISVRFFLLTFWDWTLS